METKYFKEITQDAFNKIIDFIENNDLDFDFINEVIYIYSDSGDYVINKHEPTKQIWVSSPVSGPAHFIWQDQQKWISTKGIELFSLLNNELENEK